MELRTEIEIEASPARVWSVLTDFAKYPEWNPFIVSAQGPLAVGSRLKIAISPPESREFHFVPSVIALDAERELRWRGKWGAEFLFRGEHFFRLVPLQDERTRFVHGENFDGLLVRWMARPLTHVARGFVYMNQALKRRAESEGIPSTARARTGETTRH